MILPMQTRSEQIAGIRADQQFWRHLAAEVGDDDSINDWIHDQHTDRTPEQLVADYDASYDRLIAALEAMPDDKLADPNAVPWIGDSLVNADFTGHLHDEHMPDVRAWLDRHGS